MSKIDDVDIEAFQYGMLSTYIDLCKKSESGGHPIGIIEAVRYLNYKKKERGKNGRK